LNERRTARPRSYVAAGFTPAILLLNFGFSRVQRNNAKAGARKGHRYKTISIHRPSFLSSDLQGGYPQAAFHTEQVRALGGNAALSLIISIGFSRET
jgi:hypothetical protein